MISNVFLLLTRSLASAQRINEVLSEPIALVSPPEACTDIRDGSVDFIGVSFKYHEDAEEYALSDVNLHIDAGQTVGILGGTGSAKTTLVQLIPRLYDASVGEVHVGGKNVKDYDLSSLRDAVGIVLQKTSCFPALCAKICFGATARPTTRQFGRPAGPPAPTSSSAGCPAVLTADLGQGGVNVSGGQKQRLCIARTLLKKAKNTHFR